MAKITEIAKGFAARQNTKESPAEEKNMGGPEESTVKFDPLGEMMHSPVIAQALQLLGNGSRERVNLLCAMRPFVKDEKKEKLDKIISTMKTLDLITSTQKLL
ncbi:MAG: hypothetical protein IKU24_01355 [Clostridia bacterium]|nr:hypothetical protein [Clostridia bacterium]